MKINSNQNYFLQQTERLTLRRLTASDSNDWIDFFENNDSLNYLGLDLTLDHKALAKDWVMAQLKRYKTKGLGHLGIIEKSSDQFIGMAGIIPREVNGKWYMEIAFSLKPPFWGKGYGTEVARQLKKYGFENQLANQFISIIDKRNIRSIHVAKKNDMQILFETVYMDMNVFVFGTEQK